jgi:hypothetical protein
MHIAVKSSQGGSSPVPQKTTQPSTSLRLVARVAAGILGIAGIMVGTVLFIAGMISVWIFIPMIVIAVGCGAVAIFLFREIQNAPSETNGQQLPPGNTHNQDPSPASDNLPADRNKFTLHALEVDPTDPPAVDGVNSLLDMDSVRMERVQNITEELYAWGDPIKVASWLRGTHDHSGGIAIFLFLQKKYPDFAEKVLAATNSSGGAISILPKLSSTDEKVRDDVVQDLFNPNRYNTPNNASDKIQIFEYTKAINPDLAQQIQDHADLANYMVSDRCFGLYSRVAATENPSEAAKMVIGVDGNLTGIGATVLKWLPAAVAAKIFMAIPYAQNGSEGVRWNNIKDTRLFPWLLCGMDPKEAADVLLEICKYNDAITMRECYTAISIVPFVKFMRFNPKATAQILAHMPMDAVKAIFNDGACSAAVVARVTSFLQKFNSQLIAQLFPLNLQNALEKDYLSNISISMLFSKEPHEVVSVLRLLSCDKGIALVHMFSQGNVAQMQKSAQILEILVRENLVDCQEIATGIMSRALGSHLDDHVWHCALLENLPDNLIASLICQKCVGKSAEGYCINQRNN